MTHNPAKALEKVKILLDLEAIPGRDTLFGFSIITAICKKSVPPDEIINFIKDKYKKAQKKKREKVIYDILGKDLTLRISEF